MTTLSNALLVAGLITPLVSWLSAIISVVTRWRTNRWASPVFIPFIGPMILTSWVLVENHSWWMIPAVWMLDIGTIAFAVVLPRLTRDWWNTCSFTRIMTLHGVNGIQHSVITLHSTGRYLLKKSWNRAKGEFGIVGLGEVGTFAADGDAFQLESHYGLRRRLVRTDDHSFLVDERVDDRPELTDHSLHGWLLKS